MSPKDADRMANSVDPDQTAPEQSSSRSSLIWVMKIGFWTVKQSSDLKMQEFLFDLPNFFLTCKQFAP